MYSTATWRANSSFSLEFYYRTRAVYYTSVGRVGLYVCGKVSEWTYSDKTRVCRALHQPGVANSFGQGLTECSHSHNLSLLLLWWTLTSASHVRGPCPVDLADVPVVEYISLGNLIPLPVTTVHNASRVLCVNHG